MGPTNYVACAGSGAGGGTPFDTDGLFYVNSATNYARITDGSSNTVAMSESLLGEHTPRDSKGAFSSPNPERHYKFLLSFFGPPDLADLPGAAGNIARVCTTTITRRIPASLIASRRLPSTHPRPGSIRPMAGAPPAANTPAA
jgi:hypothetical protein